MKCLPDQSSPSQPLQPPSSSPSLLLVPDICSVDSFDSVSGSTGVSERAASHGDEACGSLGSAHQICSFDQAAEIEMLVTSDGDDDDLQWANAKPVFRPATRSSGRSRRSYRTGNIAGKKKIRFPRMPVSSPRAVVHCQRPGLIGPHSVPFSGSFTPRKKNSFGGKLNNLPSIIPVNLPRRKVGFNGGDPVSPDVTCLGRIKSKKLDGIHTPKAICADLRMGQKIRCFDAKNQLYGKNCKGRKKTGRRFPSAETKSIPVEVAQTRREKAANLARSLTEMLEGLRQSQDSSSYEPTVPPPNSLLLMHGMQKNDKEVVMVCNIDEQPTNTNVDISQHCEPMEPPPNSLLLMRGCRVRGQDIDVVHKFSNKKTVQLPQFRSTLNQRRSFAELSSIEVSWRTKIDM